MGIQTYIDKLDQDLEDAYTACEAKGATMPTSQGYDSLAATIDTISGGQPWNITNGRAINGVKAESERVPAQTFGVYTKHEGGEELDGNLPIGALPYAIDTTAGIPTWIGKIDGKYFITSDYTNAGTAGLYRYTGYDADIETALYGNLEQYQQSITEISVGMDNSAEVPTVWVYALVVYTKHTMKTMFGTSLSYINP